MIGEPMSIEIFVLSDSRLSSSKEWQVAIDAEGFTMQLSHEPLEASGGSLTVQLDHKPTCLEYRFEEFGELKAFYKMVNFGQDWRYLLALPWISGFDGLSAAWMAATAYARAASGVVFDPQEAKLFDPDEARQVVRHIEKDRPRMETWLQNYVDELSTKSPEAEAALRTFMQRRSTKF
jgi:hypothetical protein